MSEHIHPYYMLK